MQHQRNPHSDLSAERRALGFAVRETRARRGLSQEQLGFRSRLHRNYVGAIERGEINPTFRTLRQITGGLGIDLSYLVRLYERNIQEASGELARTGPPRG